jgi:hypothetical protein
MADTPMFAVERRRPQPGLRLVRGTNLAYGSVRQWVALVYQVGGPVRCSSPHYNRCALLYRSLGAADLRICRDLDEAVTHDSYFAAITAELAALGGSPE